MSIFDFRSPVDRFLYRCITWEPWPYRMVGAPVLVFFALMLGEEKTVWPYFVLIAVTMLFGVVVGVLYGIPMAAPDFAWTVFGYVAMFAIVYYWGRVAYAAFRFVWWLMDEPWRKIDRIRYRLDEWLSRP